MTGRVLAFVHWSAPYLSRKWSTSTPEEQLAGNLLVSHHGCIWDTSWTGAVAFGLILVSVLVLLLVRRPRRFSNSKFLQVIGSQCLVYPNPTCYPVFFSRPDPTPFSFENHWVAGNPEYQMLPDISGITRYFGYSQTWLGIGKSSKYSKTLNLD